MTATRHAGHADAWSRPSTSASVELALEHEVDILKVASCSALDWPLLEAIAAAGKPVICSTGGKSIHDIDKIVSFFDHRYVKDLALLHCVGLYPTPDAQVQMRFMQRMQERYRHLPVGYSGHEAPDNLDVVKAAVALGARILERHVGLAREGDAAERLLHGPRADRGLGGSRPAHAGDLRDGPREGDPARGGPLAAPAHPRRVRPPPHAKGEAAHARETCSSRCPAARARPRAASSWTAMTASRDYAEGEPLTESRSRGSVEVMREAIHDAKGMLQEAGIEIGSQFEVELSHHHGPAAVPPLRGGHHQPAEPRVLQEAHRRAARPAPSRATSTR